MSEPVILFIFAIVAGGIGGFIAAAIYIKTMQQYLEEQALELRKAARRLETANRMEGVRLAVNRGRY
jgi:hypothetical protein